MAESNVLDVTENDGPVATGETVTISEKVEVPEYKDTLTITVPQKIRENGPVNPETKEARKPGEKYEIDFSFGQAEDETQAQAIATAKGEGWSLTDFVNERLKNQARANAYARELALYKESDMSPEKARERLIRGFILQGVPEAAAISAVDAILKNK